MKAKGLLDPGKMFLIILVGFVFVTGLAASSAVIRILEPDKAEANALLDKYIRAFQARNMSLASEVYAHDDDLIVFGSNPSDLRHGWGQTEEYLRKYFASVDRIEIVLQERNVKFYKTGDVAWFAQVLTWKEIERGKSYTMDGLRITGVLEKRDRGWVIVQLHASGPPPVS
jgi:ketosteroid isomerase-like protein